MITDFHVLQGPTEPVLSEDFVYRQPLGVEDSARHVAHADHASSGFAENPGGVGSDVSKPLDDNTRILQVYAFMAESFDRDVDDATSSGFFAAQAAPD